MEYTYRKLDSCGTTFFRILSRTSSTTNWVVVPATFDYDLEHEARRKVEELKTKSAHKES